MPSAVLLLSACGTASLLQVRRAAIDISCTPSVQQQTGRSPLQLQRWEQGLGYKVSYLTGQGSELES